MSDSNHGAIDTLSLIPYFAALDAAAMEAVARAVDRQGYRADQVVFLEGDPSDGLYIVQDGWLKAIKMSPDGREQVLQFIGPGEVFNAVGIFVGAPNPATVVTLEPATVWIMRREAMFRLLDEHPTIARAVIQNLAGRLMKLVSLVEDLSLRTVEARLARYLLEEAEADTLHRQRWATQAEIASRLGTVPDVLNRALRNLAAGELIEVRRHQILILDRQGLEAKSQLDT